MTTPEHAIARIEDPTVREAILTVRSEFFSGLHGIRVTVEAIAKEVSTHVTVCTNERRADEQWRASATRILNDFKVVVDSVEKVQAALAEQITSQGIKARSWVIGVLIAVAGGQFAIIVKLLMDHK